MYMYSSQYFICIDSTILSSLHCTTRQLWICPLYFWNVYLTFYGSNMCLSPGMAELTRCGSMRPCGCWSSCVAMRRKQTCNCHTWLMSSGTPTACVLADISIHQQTVLATDMELGLYFWPWKRMYMTHLWFQGLFLVPCYWRVLPIRPGGIKFTWQAPAEPVFTTFEIRIAQGVYIVFVWPVSFCDLRLGGLSACKILSISF